MTQLKCENVSLGYEGKAVTENLNFTVEQGDYLCIIGENGTGKSTLIKAILRLQQPLKGTITTGDGLLPAEIGYLPQQTVVQRDFPASVKEVVLSGCLNRLGRRAFYSAEDKALASKNMELLGISGLEKKCYRNLSGGQQQRVLLARALCATKKMLLLDEPVAGLDPKVSGDMYALIEKLNKEHGITIIMVSHDISQTMRDASHILHLSREPLFFGTKSEYLKSSIGQAFTTLMIANVSGGEEDE